MVIPFPEFHGVASPLGGAKQGVVWLGIVRLAIAIC